MIELRASKIGKARDCAPSIFGPGLEIESDREPADLGSGVHHLLLCGIGFGQHLEVADVAAIYAVDPDALDRLAGQCWAAWNLIKHHFPEPRVEQYVEFQANGFKLTGHVDILSGPPLVICDLKTGWRDDGHMEQLKAYAFLALHAYDEGEDNVHVSILKPRPKPTFETWLLHRDELEAWWNNLTTHIRHNQNVYRPSYRQCRDCSRGPSCPARAELAQEAQKFLPGLSPAKQIDRIRLLEKICQEQREHIKAQVALEGGRIEDGDRELVIETTEREEIQYTPESQRILMNEDLDADDWQSIARLSKTEIRNVVFKKYPHGRKGVLFDGLMQELRHAGAVETTFVDRLEVRRNQNDR